jgi:hypothetical protein
MVDSISHYRESVGLMMLPRKATATAVPAGLVGFGVDVDHAEVGEAVQPSDH